LSHHIDEIYKGYVMTSQRDTHQLALNRAPDSASENNAKVELF